jgi:hypothetical protein
VASVVLSLKSIDSGLVQLVRSFTRFSQTWGSDQVRQPAVSVSDNRYCTALLYCNSTRINNAHSKGDPNSTYSDYFMTR